MKMTLEQYIVNPMGKRNAVMNAVAREAIAGDYLKRYARVMMREHSNINYFLYKKENANKYVAHIKVPSETVPKFFYDVVLEFTADENVKGGGEDLFKYNCRFYSNDPSFVYTYAYVFNNDDLFYSDLRSKMSKEALKKAPDQTNPSKAVGYVKTIYFAYLFMRARDLNVKSKFTSLAKNFSLAELTRSIENADDKVAKRQEEGNKIRATRSAEKAREKKETTPKVSTNVNQPRAIMGNIGTVSTIGKKAKITARRSNRK